VSHIPARILGAAAATALLIAPVATASQAEAATQPPARATLAVVIAQPFGWVVEAYSQKNKIDGRSTRSVRAATTMVTELNESAGFTLLKLTGLTDRNRDGRDDDGRITLRAFDNIAVLNLHKNGTVTVTDGGFVFKNRLSVLKESAQSFDRVLRAMAPLEGKDTWAMSLIKDAKAEMPTGVRVVSDYDGNHDGYDDDGRLTFLARGKAVTLTIGNTGRTVGKVSYGPTWKAKAPKRTHRPVA